MSQTKTTRAFRTISEAGEELELQPHVLRFWESKFSHIKPIKRGGGRRFYRPEDIEFIRGIKKLLHDEKHPIKDVQKLIQKKGANRIIELGRSLEKASKEKAVAETDLLPKRIKTAETTTKKPILSRVKSPNPVPTAPVQSSVVAKPKLAAVEQSAKPVPADTVALEDALQSLQNLKSRWGKFRNDGEKH